MNGGDSFLGGGGVGCSASYVEIIRAAGHVDGYAIVGPLVQNHQTSAHDFACSVVPSTSLFILSKAALALAPGQAGLAFVMCLCQLRAAYRTKGCCLILLRTFDSHMSIVKGVGAAPDSSK